MTSTEIFMSLLGFSGITLSIVLAILLLYKMEKIKLLEQAVGKLKTSLNEMDEQAKLIVRTDMELNKAQEELDKKIVGLYALQKLSRSISTTLEENLIFEMIDASVIEELGFEKACCFLFNADLNQFLLQLNIGYSREQIEGIKKMVALDKGRYLDLIKEESTTSSISLTTDPEFREKVGKVFGVASFIASPLLPKEGHKGFFVAGTLSRGTLISEGDEELITILANQLGQALENARLFEKTWRAHQELEKKVEERTRELSQALEEVKMISRRKTDFVSSVTHELRTPLTSIKGYAAILLSEKLGAVPPPLKERLEKINRHSDELAQFVNDLLDISRIESGRVSMEQKPHDLKSIMEEAMDLLSDLIKEKQIGFSYNIPQEAQSVYVDRSQIKRVLINLIHNAIKFTPSDGKITVSCTNIDHEVRIDVQDSGYGIPDSSADKIFEEFYRVDNPINQQVKGSGLGLALVKNIIEAHKGKIWVKSKLGNGSTFSFTLPKPIQ
ncbi:MAG: GAF domain-containing sensor histidine kinase [Candidatus Omnitrophota bacterium]